VALSETIIHIHHSGMIPARALAIALVLGGTVCGELRAEPAVVPDLPRQTDVWKPWLERKLLPVTEAPGMLRAFVEQQLQPLPLPESKQAWLARRDDLRREILTLLGIDDLVPATWDLAITRQGTLQREGYRIERLSFESYPGMAISAVLYVPDGVERRTAGIVSISGHTAISKAADYVQQRNVNLALRGCVVLSYDYYGYGDRRTGDDPLRPTGANGHGICTFSHTRRSATSLEVLDAIRAVDLLAARPDVDPERIGFTGESGGGNSTYWIAALDPRVKLAVPVSSVTTFDYWIRTDANWDWHQRPPGIRRIADIGTLLALHAPHPMLIISSKRGTDDEEFPLEEAEKSCQWAGHVYRLNGVEEVLAHYESSTAHGYQQDKREQLYLAIERWLQPPHPQGGTELPVTLEKSDDLRCRLPENNLTVHDVYNSWLQELPRGKTLIDQNELRVKVRQRLGWPSKLPDLKAKRLAREENGKLTGEFWSIETEPGIRLPAVYIQTGAARGVIALVPGRDEGAVAKAIAAGQSVLALDLRGAGELGDRTAKASRWPRMAGASQPELLNKVDASVLNWAWFAGRPWSGQWALDLAQAARFARTRLGATSVTVKAENGFGWAALLAAAARPELIDSGNVHVPRASFIDDIRQRGDASLADVPGLLELVDIPQLRGLWPGGQVTIMSR
jgi:hypothetical protein